MKTSYVDASKIKTLEDYTVALTLSLMSIKTLKEYHSTAIEKGILSDDMAVRAKIITFDLLRASEQYTKLLEAILEVIPDTFNADTILEGLKKTEVKKARELTRKAKIK